MRTYLSPSAAALWKECPRKWWYRYVDRLPEPPPGEPAIIGSFVHKVLELLLDHPAEERTAEVARGIARATFDEFEHRGDYRSLGLDDNGSRRFRQRAWTMIETYFSEFQPEQVQPVHQELAIDVEIDGIPFKGFVDLVERDAAAGGNAVIVTDYKTGKPPEIGKPWSKDRNAEKLLQPLWYAAALLEIGEHTPTLARLLYFTAVDTPSGGLEGRTGHLASRVDDVSLDAARAELGVRWRQIGEAREAGQADASPSRLCGWCPFVAHCEEGRAEVVRLRSEVNSRTGAPLLRDDAPALAELGLT